MVIASAGIGLLLQTQLFSNGDLIKIVVTHIIILWNFIQVKELLIKLCQNIVGVPFFWDEVYAQYMVTGIVLRYN